MVPSLRHRAAAVAALATLGTVSAAGTPSFAAAAAKQAPAPEVLDVTFQSGMRLKHPVPKGMDSGSFEGYIQNLYNLIITANQPLGRYIQPSDVVVLCPANSKTIAPPKAPAKKGAKPQPQTAADRLAQLSAPVNEKLLDPNGRYSIYVIGRKFITVDPVMAKAMGAPDSKTLAFKLAKQCQQTFPRVCFRPPSLPDNVVPANPPLTLTTNIARCVPADVVSRVEMWGTPLLTVAGPQFDGSTAPDRAQALTQKVVRILGRPGLRQPDEVTVQPLAPAKKGAPAGAQVMVGGQVLFALDAVDARVNKTATAVALAEKVAGVIKSRMAEMAMPAPVATPTPETPAPETPVTPAPETPAPTPPVPTEPTPSIPPSTPPTTPPTEPAPANPPTTPPTAPPTEPAPAPTEPAPAPAPAPPATP